MTVQVDSVDTLVRVNFSNDADPDFKSQAVFLASDWQGWTTVQKLLRLAARYQDWVNSRIAPTEQQVQAEKLQALKLAALNRWQLQNDLGVTANVNPDGTVTIT